jgi:uncharacterized membrane protein YidH (DUF202 family)
VTESPRRREGSSAERTRLAWRRTALAITLVALLTIRIAVKDGISVGAGFAIAAATLGWLFAMWLTQRRVHAMAERPPRRIGRTLPAIALVMVGFALLGIALVAATGSSGR